MRSLPVTMPLSRHGRITGIAHHLTKANTSIQPQLNANPSRVNKFWGGHEIQCSVPLPSTVTLTLCLHGLTWVLHTLVLR